MPFFGSIFADLSKIHTSNDGSSWEAKVTDAAGAVRDLRRSRDGSYVSVSGLGNFYATWEPGDSVWQVHQRVSSQRLQSIGFQPDGNLWMVARGAQIRLNEEPGNFDSWSKAIIPITNGYGYMETAIRLPLRHSTQWCTDTALALTITSAAMQMDCHSHGRLQLSSLCESLELVDIDLPDAMERQL